MNEANNAPKNARDAIKTDLGNIIESAWKNRNGLCEIKDRLFGPPPPDVDKKATARESPPGLIQAVEIGLGEIRHAQNDISEILSDILARL